MPPTRCSCSHIIGWIHIRNDKTAYTNYYKAMKDSEYEEWPPKFWKFHLTTEGKTPIEVAFTDARRFGRVRLVDCPGDQIRKFSPLVENGPDPVVDKDVFTEDYLRTKMTSKHVPIKALLLDQAMISGIGNWVADETLYQAKVHPEQYCDTFDGAEIKRIYESICYVCDLAVEKLGDSDQFPDHWLFNHRWGKGSKGSATSLPNGEKLAFITVGGRTSCYAPYVQKKSGAVPDSAKTEPIKSEPAPEKTSKKGRKSTGKTVKEELEEDAPAKGKRARQSESETKKSKKVKVEPEEPSDMGRRRSGRLRK